MAAKRRSAKQSPAGRQGCRRPPAPPAERGRTALFVAAIGTSAFLLFSLELLTGRLVLPAFGGSPGVWTTALSYFTAVLFIGYGYDHARAVGSSSARPRRSDATTR